MTYAPVFAAIFVLWPVMAVLGAQGFAPMVGLTALAALAMSRPRMPIAGFAFLGFAFVAWAAVSEFWAPGAREVISGSLAEGTFSVEARSLSAVLLAIASALTIAGVLRVDASPRSSWFLGAVLFIQAVLVAASPFVADYGLSLVYGDDPNERHKGYQNMARAANTLALGLPLLLALLVFRGKIIGGVVALCALVASLAAYVLLGADSSMFACISMGLAMALVGLLPRTGFRWLFGGLAGYIAASPVLYAFLIRALDPVAQSLPASFRSRLWSWEVVIGRMTEAPFVGHGLGATRTWKDTFETRPDWLAQVPDFWKAYQIVPGHPHNMGLQIWAETGMIGAVLAALSLVALAFHLPMPGDLRPR
jgi:O-antigen ligase